MTESSPAFFGAHVTVRDMAASAAFYRLLGLTVEGDEHFSRVLGGEGPAIALGSHALTRGYDAGFVPGTGSACSLQFALLSREAVDALHAAVVAAGYESHLAPFDAFFGSRYAEVVDPDGVIVGLRSPRDASMLTPPPGGPPPVGPPPGGPPPDGPPPV